MRTDDPPRGVRVVRIDEEHAGQRLDNFLAANFRHVPRARLYRSLRTGEVRVNRSRARQGYRLREGDLVRLPPLGERAVGTPPRPGRALRERLLSSVVYEDDYLMVLDKPSGLAVHGGSGYAWGLIEALRALRIPPGFLELVHRLDRETSGCLILAKRRPGLVALHQAMREGKVDKRYRVLLCGRWRGGGRRVDQPLKRGASRTGERIVRPHPQGQPASTAFTPLAVGPRVSLMEARPITGRTHQIRVHAAGLEMPVAGDERYGAWAFNRELRELGLSRMFLHAWRVSFPHPLDGRPMDIRVPLPAELARVADALGAPVDE